MVRAIVLVDLTPNLTENTFKKIAAMKEVSESFQVYGEYDAVFVIKAQHTTEIQKFVKEIRKLPGILRTVTVIEMI